MLHGGDYNPDQWKATPEIWDEDMRLAPKRGMVEFLTTVHYVEKYLEKDMKILEIGAGSGRYS